MSNHTGNYLTRSATRLIDHTLNKRREEEQALRMRNAIAGMKGGGEEEFYNALGNARTPGEANAFINLNKMNRGLAAEDRAIKGEAWRNYYESGDTQFLARAGIPVTPELTKRGDARREYLDNKWSAENASNEEKIALWNLNNQEADPATVKELGLPPQHLDGSPWKWVELKNIRKFKEEGKDKNAKSPTIPYVLEKNGHRYQWNPETKAHDIDLGPTGGGNEFKIGSTKERILYKIHKHGLNSLTTGDSDALAIIMHVERDAMRSALRILSNDQDFQYAPLGKKGEMLDKALRLVGSGGRGKAETGEKTSVYDYRSDIHRIVPQNVPTK